MTIFYNFARKIFYKDCPDKTICKSLIINRLEFGRGCRCLGTLSMQVMFDNEIHHEAHENHEEYTVFKRCTQLHVLHGIHY
jgi:hypothetical protein